MAAYTSKSMFETLCGYKQNEITASSEYVTTTDLTNFQTLVNDAINGYLHASTDLSSGPRFLIAKKVSARMCMQFNLMRRKFQMQSPSDLNMAEIAEILTLTHEEEQLFNVQDGQRLPN